MRAFCTVSAPLEVCASAAEQLSPGSRFLALRLLGNQQPKTLYFLVDAKSRVREVYTQTCLHFATQGMLDTELFGLAVLIDGEYMFADPESKLSKYGPKSWRSSHTHGLDANGRPLLELHFRVQFYIESPFMLKDETSRHNYYLQLRHNALQRDLPRDYAEQSLLLLAGLALQADLGDAPPPSPTTCAVAAPSVTRLEKEERSGKQQAGGTTPTTTTLPKVAKRAGTALRLSIYDPSGGGGGAAVGGSRPGGDLKLSLAPSESRTAANCSAVAHIGDSLKRHLGAVAAQPATAATTTTTTTATSVTAVTTTTADATTSSAATMTATATALADYFRLDDYLPAGLRTAAAVNALRACHRENRGITPADAKLHYIRQACALHESINAHTYRMRMTKAEHGAGNSWFIVYAKGIKICTGAAAADSGTRLDLQQQQPAVAASSASAGSQQPAAPTHQITFLWPNITKLSFERKKFEIRSGSDSKITLYAASDEKNKMLLTLCRETHQFSMKIAARLKEVIKRDEEENNCLHACYSYSRSLHLPYKNNKNNDQRISVISSTSSNTTSGIVSDRVHSEDELEIMINTPPAPIAAPSTESLALAHLLDRPTSVSRQTSSVGQVSLKDLEEQLAALTVRQAVAHKQHYHQQQQQQQQYHNQQQQQQQQQHVGGSSSPLCSGGSNSPTQLSGMSSIVSKSTSSGSGRGSGSSSNPTTTADSSTATDSPSSQHHNIGSQCSSTCSTVVVAASTHSIGSDVETSSPVAPPRGDTTTTHHLTALAMHTAQAGVEHHHQRRNSTSSSLELGFSHTAQNSTLSEAESTFVPSSHDRDETESVSGVYTLAHGAPPTETSGVYTMHSSELTGQSSELAESEKSSHYGLCATAGQTTLAAIGDDRHTATTDAVDGGGGVGGGSSGVAGGANGSGGGGYHGKRIKNEEFRLRSDSNVSTSGSFRGDGSDPTDPQHTLLTAEELTDLIVGRGTYPNRKTVASTLDSDCDYVTLPLPIEGESYIQGHQDTAPTDDHAEDLMNDLLPTDPPAPPQRIDSQGLPPPPIAGRASLSNIRARSPPPYEARHEKTGLCGPPVRSTLSAKAAAAVSVEVAKTAALPSAKLLPPPPPPPSTSPPPLGHTVNAVKKVSSNLGNAKAMPLTAAPIKPEVVGKAPPPPPPTSAAIRRRDPPPYPITDKPRPTSLVSVASSTSSLLGQQQAAASAAGLAHMGGSMTSLKSEEITARFITTRPQINILKAHTSLLNETPKPSYAAPTALCSSGASSTGSVSSHYNNHHQQQPLYQHHTQQLPLHRYQHHQSNLSTASQHHLSQSHVSVHNSTYAGGSAHSPSLSLGQHHGHHHPQQQHRHHHHSSAAAAHAAVVAAAGGVMPSSIGIPIVPYGLHGAHKSMSSLHHHHQQAHHAYQHPPPPPPPYADAGGHAMQGGPPPPPPPGARACVYLPVIKPRQYLPAPLPPASQSLPRQAPPPPASAHHAHAQQIIYGGPLAHKQLELYQQQLYSDVDYVMYPIQDPAVSQQEYLDAKQAVAMAQTPPPPHPYHHLAAYHTVGAHHAPPGWGHESCKGHAIYRSTPYLPLALSTHSRYASTQNLSDSYVQLPGAYSPLYSPSVASVCSSYEPPPPPPLYPAAMAAAAVAARPPHITANTPNHFARSRSDDNILNSLDSLPKMKRIPPPPPPPYVNRQLKKPPMPAPTEKPPPIPSKPPGSCTASFSAPPQPLPSAPSTSSSTAMAVTSAAQPIRHSLQLSAHRKPPTLSAGRNGHSYMTKTSSGAQWAGERPRPELSIAGRGNSSILAHLQASMAATNRLSAPAGSLTPAATSSGGSTNALDIALLREKSKNLGLPLISALCNDRSLLKQTRVLANPKHGRNAASSVGALTSVGAAATTAAVVTTTSGSVAATTASTAATTTSAALSVGTATSLSPSVAVSTPTTVTSSTNGCSPPTAVALATTPPAVTGGGGGPAPVATTTTPTTTAASPPTTVGKYIANAKPRKTSISHRHPNDKLPPLPMQLAEANNYVMDPALPKHHHQHNHHKSYNP